MKLSSKMFVITLLIIVFIFSVTGCSSKSDSDKDISEKNENEEDKFNEEFTRPDYNDLPDEIKEWIDNSKMIFLGQKLEHKGKLYVLVTYGEKPTGGYSVKITELDFQQDAVTVKVEFTDPKKGQPVTEAITYPYDIIALERSDKEVKFESEDKKTYIPTLVGINKLEPIAAGGGGIRIFEPKPGEKTRHEINFRGIANTFEGTVNYSLETYDNNIVTEGYVTGSMGDWGYFQKTITIPAEAPYRLILKIFTISPKDGEKINELRIPITWEYDK